MNCGQTVSIPQSGQNESQHHNLPIQNRHVRGDGSTASLGQVDMLTVSDKFCRWLACWNIATDITGAHSSAHVWTLRGGMLILRQMLAKHVNRSLVVAHVYSRCCDGRHFLSRKYYLLVHLFCLMIQQSAAILLTEYFGPSPFYISGSKVVTKSLRFLSAQYICMNIFFVIQIV